MRMLIAWPAAQMSVLPSGGGVMQGMGRGVTLGTRLERFKQSYMHEKYFFEILLLS